MGDQTINNQNATIKEQINVVGRLQINKFTINNQSPEKVAVDLSNPIEYHLPKPIDSFVGRDNEMKLLNNLFFEKRQQKVVISGMPGYGKSELAKQFLKKSKNEHRFKHILWMDAETPDNLLQSFKNLAKLVGLPEMDKESLIKMVYDLFSNESAIVVLDNAKTRESVLEFEPLDLPCLVTSHVKDWGDDFATVDLMPLAPGAAVDVIKLILGERYQPNDYAQYMELARVVSYVPFSLQISSAYIREEMIDLGKDFSLEEYIAELAAAPDEFVSKSFPDFSANPYRSTIYKSVLKTFQKLKDMNTDKSNLALNIIQVCSYLYTENIQLGDLKEIQFLNKLLENCKHPLKDLKRAVSLLNNYCFINFDDDQISMHRLIQEILIFHQNNNQEHCFYTACLEFILSFENEYHRYSVISHSDKKVDTFFEFYTNRKEDFLMTDMFFKYLVIAGNVITLKKLLEDVKDNSALVINEFLLLHEAAASRQHEVLELLLKFGADVNKKNPDQETAIFEAVIKLDLHAVQVLVKAGAVLNLHSRYGDTLLHTAITVSGPPWQDMLQEPTLRLLRFLVQKGCDPHATQAVLGNTLLHNAALALRPSLVQALEKEYHFKVDTINKIKRTPLHSVSDAINKWYLGEDRRIETARILLQLGASMDVIDAFGRTPLEHAKNEGYNELVKFLEDPRRDSLELDVKQLNALSI